MNLARSLEVVELGTVAAATVPDYGDGTDILCIVLHLPWRSLSEVCPHDFFWGDPSTSSLCGSGKGGKIKAKGNVEGEN